MSSSRGTAPGERLRVRTMPSGRSRLSLMIAAIALAVPACENLPVGEGEPEQPMPGEPLNGLTQAEQDLFTAGREVFERSFTAETGAGPLFNGFSCLECHSAPAVGGNGMTLVRHATAWGGSCDLLEDLGGPVYQQAVTQALRDQGITTEPVPAAATALGLRIPPDVFGFGLLDAVSEDAILALADPDDLDGDGISGRVHILDDGRVGRFGRKANVADIQEFVTGAFPIELGVTTPGSPDENTIGGEPLPAGVDPTPDPELPQPDVDATAMFIRLLAPPAPAEDAGEHAAGSATFDAVGCADCHVRSLTTGAHEIDALSGKTVTAYTDLLLHDMGPERADVCFGDAAPGEFRTEPLMGLRFVTNFMHDGAATSIQDAILLHGGEGAASRDAFAALGDEQRQALLRFLESL